MMGSRRRPLGRSYSGNNGPRSPFAAAAAGGGGGQGSDGEDNGPLAESRPDRRSYLLSVRPENRSTFCAIIAQLTEETQPIFEITLKSYAVSEDADAKFTCIVTGYPQPEVTWYKDDEEMDRYCGLPKYEIFRHGNRHTLQLYRCTEEDAAIYQASARNSKGIVSCSGVLEVGKMTEYKIHQRWFAKLKRNAEAKLREIEQSRKRGKENVEIDQLRRVSPDRFQRKRRLTGEIGMHSGTSLWDKEEKAKVRIPDGKPRFGEADKAKNKESPLNTTSLFSNNFITGQLEGDVKTNGDSSLESGEENGEENTNGFLTYIYETVEIMKAKPATKDFAAKKKKKEENTNTLPSANQDISQQEERTQSRINALAQKDTRPSSSLSKSVSSLANRGLTEAEPKDFPSHSTEKTTSLPSSMPSKSDVYFSLKDMYLDIGAKAEAEQQTPEPKAGRTGVGQPAGDASILEESLPITRAYAEQKMEENEAIKTENAKMAVTEMVRDLNTTLFQHPIWPMEPKTEVQPSLKIGTVSEMSNKNAFERDLQHPSQASETGFSVQPSFSKETETRILDGHIRETDLLDSLPIEVEPAPQPQSQSREPGDTDTSSSLQEARQNLQKAILEEQLHTRGLCKAAEDVMPVSSTASNLQTPDSDIRTERNQDSTYFAIRKSVPREIAIQQSKKEALPNTQPQGPNVVVPSQEVNQYLSETSQNHPSVSFDITQPTEKKHLLVEEGLRRQEIQHRQAPSHGNEALAGSRSPTQNTRFEARPTDQLGQVVPQTEAAKTFESLGDNRPSPQMDSRLEDERLLKVTTRPLLVSEVALKAPTLHQNVPEKPQQVPVVVMSPVPCEPQEPALLSPASPIERNQSVTHLLRDVKREIETWPQATEQQVHSTAAEEIQDEEEFSTPPEVVETEQKAYPLSKKLEVQAGERETTSEDNVIQDLQQPETAMEEDEAVEKSQHKNLVSSLKNYLLLLLKMTTEKDKSKSKMKQETKMVEQKSPPSLIPKHVADVGVAGLTPRTSRKIFERVENNQLFQSAESLQLTPKTSRRLTGMINQELLACKETLMDEPEVVPLPCVPSIIVGSAPSEPEGPSDLSPEVSSEAPVALPSATPQELASGARRKIFLPKTKQADEMEGLAPESQMPRGKRDSPTVSPQQSRRSTTLLQTLTPASPPGERRSPTLSRKMATLEVPKIYEEPAEETKSVSDSCLTPLESLQENIMEMQVGESRKVNDPFKAPQVIRKIRAEQFSDASGNLKLWCQFFNILSDSKLTWYKDEVPMAEVKRSSGDEGQAVLAIVQVSQKDCGVYQCTIQNEYGTDSTDFLLSAEVLSGFIFKEEVEAGEEIEMTPMVFAKGLADSGFWGDKLFGRIMVEDLDAGQSFLRKACRARAIYGLEPVFESGHTGIIKVRNLIAFGGRSESTVMERNYDITIQECKIQNSSREYCKIFAAEARAVPDFGQVPEIIPLYLIYRPANNIPYATMEEDLPGQFERYCRREPDDGSVAPANLSEVGQKCCTFQHWLYQWTNGNILVTDLEGVGWKVTNVRIATKTKGYQGLKESCSPNLLDQFAASHQCNHYCKLLALQRLEIPQPPPKGKGSRSPIMGRKTSSTQSSPQLPKKGLASPQAFRKGSVSPKSARKSPDNGALESQLGVRPLKGGDNGKVSQLQ
ncbi:alpha-protein kinase 3 isoform X2 [Sceloporus undulatus]|uniref:alpha-protein kinase 3 isoform X2 n=1 Tax=Sceloporus undulatus TaxID=8520 RepID=UPI001C4AB7B2|nr:alpha-protein kinase 3 isoform X2 [Sceloporus undulatus]